MFRNTSNHSNHETKYSNSKIGTPNTLTRQGSLTGASSPEVSNLTPISGAPNPATKTSNSGFGQATQRTPRTPRTPKAGEPQARTSRAASISEPLPDSATARKSSRHSTSILSKLNHWRRDSSHDLSLDPGQIPSTPDTGKFRKRAASLKPSKAPPTTPGDTRSWASAWRSPSFNFNDTPGNTARSALTICQVSAGITSGRKKPLWHVARDIITAEFEPPHFSTLPDPHTFDVNQLTRCFPALLTNEIGLACFIRFCDQNFALENMLFYEAVTSVLEHPIPDSFHAIQTHYLNEDAEHNVNISGELRRAISDQITRMDALGGIVGKDLVARLQDAQQEIFLVMERDLFHRFLSSPQHSEGWRLECRTAIDNLAKHQPNAKPPPPPPPMFGGKETAHSLEFSSSQLDSSDSEPDENDSSSLLLGRRAGVFSAAERGRTPTVADLSTCHTMTSVLDESDQENAEDDAHARVVVAAARASRRLAECDLSYLVKKATLPDLPPPSHRPLSERSMSARIAKRESEALMESRLIARQQACSALDVNLAEVDCIDSARRRPSTLSRRSYSAREIPQTSRLTQRVTLDDFDISTMQRTGRTTDIEVASATAEAGACTEERVQVRQDSVMKSNEHLRMLVLRRSLREIQMAPVDDLKNLLRDNEHLVPVVARLHEVAEGMDSKRSSKDDSEVPPARFERPVSDEYNLAESNSAREGSGSTRSSDSDNIDSSRHQESLAKAIQRARLRKTQSMTSPVEQVGDDGYGAVLNRLKRALQQDEQPQATDE